MILMFNDNTSKKYHLNVNSEGEEGLLVDNSDQSEGNAFHIPVEKNNKLREVIESNNH